MDEEEYKTVSNQTVPVACVFEKSILAIKCSCVYSKKKNIAERQVVMCTAVDRQQRCNSWLQLLRKKSQFSLRIPDVDELATPLPHAKEMKVQVGGIYGLATHYGITSKDEGLLDVSELLEKCVVEEGGFAELPFDEIVKEITHFRLR